MEGLENASDDSYEVSLKDVLKAVKAQGDINSKLRQDLAELKNEVQGSNISVASQVKKLKTDTDYKWKFESNKIQFSLNSDVLEDLNQAIWAIENRKTDYAKETILEAVEKLKKRNKSIKIADTSEGGWETVRQYESNPIASDTDDENRINKAENRALRKRKFKSNKKSSKPSSTVPPPQHLPNYTVSSQQVPFRDPQTWYGGFPLYHNTPSTSGSQRKVQQGGCYGCGSMQHWRNRCPFNPKSEAYIKPKAE